MFHSFITRSQVIDLGDITVRLITSRDTAAITAYYQKNRQFLEPWEPLREDTFFTARGWERRLEQLMKLHKHEMAYYFVIVPKQDPLQICGVVNYSNLVRHPFYACHVGYSIDEDYQGQGMMGRALEATNQWMFDKGFHRIMAAYMPRNAKSAAVLKKSGFAIEGRAKDYLLINGNWEDHILTARINSDWAPPLG
ncbi:ribosomal-protein-alanine acetyltransferase [Photobacterium aquae]|uniref:Ribosomal-protein-alanine acetyltransferase n=1 Tax=Photobacterium aquae TaxID=1195763 RepID=A0A0J1HCF5_9GAMM|nr:ribosomal protein S5-alanine N-acetyltransferase [Photobacterium aquae]KLV09338.1 ribosomal-protein-alanine acetyltransferase [Photobacterium aquae]